MILRFISEHGALLFVTDQDTIGVSGHDDEWTVSLAKGDFTDDPREETVLGDKFFLHTRDEALAVVRRLAAGALDFSSTRVLDNGNVVVDPIADDPYTYPNAVFLFTR